MSALLGEAVGQTVGYRVRLEQKVSPATRIEVVTTGVLLRRLLGQVCASYDSPLRYSTVYSNEAFIPAAMKVNLNMSAAASPGGPGVFNS